ncbi:hypothetical protein [Hymenobacter sp. CRA2]|uniref:hypothetical protein n=1 Tax=Hymenobacter sp. CRA2 TaxID=1955620 RepID=UPI001117289A|nr:hypothetical protein [Hymenobacter sp. CRA2]
MDQARLLTKSFRKSFAHRTELDGASVPALLTRPVTMHRYALHDNLTPAENFLNSFCAKQRVKFAQTFAQNNGAWKAIAFVLYLSVTLSRILREHKIRARFIPSE